MMIGRDGDKTRHGWRRDLFGANQISHFFNLTLGFLSNLRFWIVIILVVVRVEDKVTGQGFEKAASQKVVLTPFPSHIFCILSRCSRTLLANSMSNYPIPYSIIVVLLPSTNMGDQSEMIWSPFVSTVVIASIPLKRPVPCLWEHTSSARPFVCGGSSHR